MTLSDFLVARALETLERRSCDYYVAGGRVICLCETPSAQVEKTLAELDLIRWSEMAFGPTNPIEALLADRYAAHPDYDPEWHFIIGSE